MASKLEDEYRRQLLEAGVPRWIANYNLHYVNRQRGTRQLQVDFAWPDYKVAAEVQGGTHCNGSHNTPDGYRYDREKSNWAQLNDWILLEFASEHIIKSTYALETTLQAIQKRTDGRDSPTTR